MNSSNNNNTIIKKVCIVGASGKLGQYMIQHALDRNYEVVGVCREKSVGKLDTFKESENPVPWMLRVGRNLCIDRLRRIKARPPAVDVPAEEASELTATGPSPEESAETEVQRRLVYRALDGMNDKHREMILLKEIQGLKLDEIAKLLKEPLGTIKSRSNRARIELASRVRALDPSYGA